MTDISVALHGPAPITEPVTCSREQLDGLLARASAEDDDAWVLMCWYGAQTHLTLHETREDALRVFTASSPLMCGLLFEAGLCDPIAFLLGS